MTEYEILQGSDFQSLQIKVRGYLRNGWTTAGGVTISSQGMFYQAVVK